MKKTLLKKKRKTNMKIKKLRALDNFKIEIKELVNFYKANINYLESLKSIDIWENTEIKNKTESIDSKLNFQSNQKAFRVRDFKSNLPFISRELIFIRAISTLEVFLVEAVKDVFKHTTVPFRDNKLFMELNNSEILNFKSISYLKNKLLHKETRPLSSGGYDDIIKYYKKRFKIDLAGIGVGKNKIKYYHEIRHLLVHRLGKTDKKFKKSYGINKMNISVDEELFLQMLDDIYSYGAHIGNKIIDLIEFHNKPIIYKKFSGDRFIIQFNSELKHKIKFLQPNYHFWSGDEIYHFKDLNSEFTNEKGKVCAEIWGEKEIIIPYVKNIKQRLRTSNLFSELTIKFIKHPKEFDESIILAIDSFLPKQPWKKGIHKKVAEEFNISNSIASKVMVELIKRGKYKPQKNEKINPE